MASPIKDTPILRGEDARRFERGMRLAEKQPITQEELRRIDEAMNKFRLIGTGCA